MIQVLEEIYRHLGIFLYLFEVLDEFNSSTATWNVSECDIDTLQTFNIRLLILLTLLA